ncbi:hypothetical protein ACFWPQ_51510 [Streptomyces sp. NPDC058464]|uniref:hypothetical protein n=1 Tax=Streptomyces sp. NPDC058464 TaxID=3346511 RepID=UPI0036491A91
MRVVAETRKPIPETAEDLGIHPGTLHSWVSQARRSGLPFIGPTGGRAIARSCLRESQGNEWERLRGKAGRRTSASRSSAATDHPGRRSAAEGKPSAEPGMRCCPVASAIARRHRRGLRRTR